MADVTRGTVLAPTQVTVGPTATLIVGAKTRLNVMLRNLSATTTVYLGVSNAVTITTGFPLRPGERYRDEYGVQDWYGITSGGSAIVGVLEQVP